MNVAHIVKDIKKNKACYVWKYKKRTRFILKIFLNVFMNTISRNRPIYSLNVNKSINQFGIINGFFFLLFRKRYLGVLIPTVNRVIKQNKNNKSHNIVLINTRVFRYLREDKSNKQDDIDEISGHTSKYSPSTDVTKFSYYIIGIRSTSAKPW